MQFFKCRLNDLLFGFGLLTAFMSTNKHETSIQFLYKLCDIWKLKPASTTYWTFTLDKLFSSKIRPHSSRAWVLTTVTRRLKTPSKRLLEIKTVHHEHFTPAPSAGFASVGQDHTAVVVLWLQPQSLCSGKSLVLSFSTFPMRTLESSMTEYRKNFFILLRQQQ